MVSKNHAAPFLRQRMLPALALVLVAACLAVSCASFPSLPSYRASLRPERLPDSPGAFAAVQTGHAPDASVVAGPVPDGRLVEASPVYDYSASQMQSLFFWVTLPVLSNKVDTAMLSREKYPQWREGALQRLRAVKGVRIRFMTEALPGQPDIQSGLLLLPAPDPRARQSTTLSWIIYTKGTELNRQAVPSKNAGIETWVAESYAALGYAVWVPDYAGMGDSRGTHPFCVPESLAASAVDGLAAAREYLALAAADPSGATAYRESGRLAVIGYSEGGLASLATARSLSQKPSPGLDLVKVWAMGAPLNLAAGYQDILKGNPSLGHPEYYVALVLGWARTSPQEIQPASILDQRIVDNALPLFDGSRDGSALRSEIEKLTGRKSGEVRVSDIFSTGFLDQLKADPASLPIYRKQLSARMDQWLPPAELPVVLAASPSDSVVNPANSTDAHGWISTQRPDYRVTLVKLGGQSHGVAGGEALLMAIMQFDREERAKR
jgi:pimeloyl-ACP methyl ester carboxylesterase